MINLRNSPFFWFALLLLLAFSLFESTGFFLAVHIRISLWIICLFTTFLAILKYKPGQQVKSTLAISVLLIAAGTLRVSEFKTSLYPAPLLSGSTQMAGLLEVQQVLKVKESGVSLKCKVISMSSITLDTALEYTDRFILIRIKEIDKTQFLPKDRIEITGWVSAIRGPLNPHAFDIRNYYHSIGIRHQMFCKGEVLKTIPPTQSSVMRITSKWQENLSSIVKTHTSPEVAQLTNALVWGDRSDMAAEVRDAFADSGAMHVLSVSGMHMAIVYSMLYLILGAPGAGTFSRRMFRLVCYAVAIILYMGLTGACPAVVRSGLMILLFLLGKAMGWNTPIWNLLGFAAFVMLWINPFVYVNIGFQLSFLAMGGILLYAQPMIRFLTFKHILAHRIWEITAVSIAAQIFILPLLLKQFHQFPLTFIASSLVAMPASYVIIFGALLNVILSLMSIDWLWPLLDTSGHYFILSMKWMAGLNPEMNFSLPAAGSMFIFLMAILFSVALAYHWSNGKKLAYLLGAAAFINLGSHRAKQWGTNDVVIYHLYQGLLVDVFVDGNCFSIRDSSITIASVEFAARGNRCYRDVIHTTTLSTKESFQSEKWSYTSSVLHVSNADILIWNDETSSITKQGHISHVLVNQCKNLTLLKNHICGQSDIIVIIPAHLDRTLKNKLLWFLKNNAIRYFDIAQQGYFRMEI
jgi:competence protein ComEC